MFGIVFAQQGIDNVDGVATIKGFEGLFYNLLSSVVAIAGVVLFVMLLVGGFKYTTSGDNPKAAESAKKTLTYAIGGLVVIALGYLILLFVANFTGADILDFSVVVT